MEGTECTVISSPFHHFITLYVNFHGGWKVGVGGNMCKMQEMDRVKKGEGRREKEGAMTELKALCLYKRLQAN